MVTILVPKDGGIHILLTLQIADTYSSYIVKLGSVNFPLSNILAFFYLQSLG
jgi:hypothetical protein